jgi:hypothetical protein
MEHVELRIMPNGKEGRWYWEVIKDGREVLHAVLPTQNPLRVSRRIKRRKKRSWLNKLPARP